MRKHQQTYRVFIIFALASILILIISPYPVVSSASGFIARLISPLQKSVYVNLSLLGQDENEKLTVLEKENLELKRRLAGYKSLEADNRALRDQFAKQTLSSHKLLPVNILGVDIMIPGEKPQHYIINAGSKQSVKKGSAVVYNDILIGIITSSSDELSTVTLVNNGKTAIAARSLETGALGIIHGTGGNVFFDQVLVSETLRPGDLIITRGNIDESGTGYPPGLKIGEIAAVNKKPSALFQSAKLNQLVDVSRLNTVFVLVR